MNNKNISVWRGDNTPPTSYHLWLKSDGRLFVYIDENWQEIDKAAIAGINKVLEQHAQKLSDHQESLDVIDTLHSKLWIPGKGDWSIMSQGVKNSIADDETKGALGNYSYAEGCATTSNGKCSHAEGNSTIANNDNTHAEGSESKALGWSSHAEGNKSIASGTTSHAEGTGTVAVGSYSHVQGRYNISNANAIDSIGIGINNSRKNSEFTYLHQTGTDITEDSKNGYKYLIGIGGYDGVSTDIATYKSLQEVISDITSTLKVKADLVDGKIPLDQLSNLDMVLFEVVKELPTTNIKKHIYLMAVSELEAGAKNMYAEYIYTGDITTSYDETKWEKLGVKQIETDLSDYYTKEETNEQIQSIKNKFPLSIASFSSSPSIALVGTTNVTLTWRYNNDDINTITNQSINDISVANNLRTKTDTVTSDKAIDKTYTLKGNGITKAITIHIVNASYYGVVSASTTTITNVEELTSLTKYGTNLTQAFNQANQKIVYLYPATFGALTSIKDQNGFEGISGFDKQEVTINNISYLLYISKIPATSSVTLTFK